MVEKTGSQVIEIRTPEAKRLSGVLAEAVRHGRWEAIRERECEGLDALGLTNLAAFVYYAAEHDPHEGRKPLS